MCKVFSLFPAINLLPSRGLFCLRSRVLTAVQPAGIRESGFLFATNIFIFQNVALLRESCEERKNKSCLNSAIPPGQPERVTQRPRNAFSLIAHLKYVNQKLLVFRRNDIINIIIVLFCIRKRILFPVSGPRSCRRAPPHRHPQLFRRRLHPHRQQHQSPPWPCQYCRSRWCW